MHFNFYIRKTYVKLQPRVNGKTGEIGARLKAARLASRMTGEEAGRQLGLKPSQISKMENGQQRIPADLLPQWCDVVGITLAEAYGRAQAHHFSLIPFSPRIARLYAELPDQWQLHAQRAIESLHRLYEKDKNRS